LGDKSQAVKSMVVRAFVTYEGAILFSSHHGYLHVNNSTWGIL